MYVCVCQSMYVSIMHMQVPVGRVTLVTLCKCGGTGSCDFSDVATKDRTQVLCRKIKCALGH